MADCPPVAKRRSCGTAGPPWPVWASASSITQHPLSLELCMGTRSLAFCSHDNSGKCLQSQWTKEVIGARMRRWAFPSLTVTVHLSRLALPLLNYGIYYLTCDSLPPSSNCGCFLAFPQGCSVNLLSALHVVGSVFTQQFPALSWDEGRNLIWSLNVLALSWVTLSHSTISAIPREPAVL